jgi:tripartite-type tricarboxylate transporter receptor subunit TctC
MNRLFRIAALCGCTLAPALSATPAAAQAAFPSKPVTIVVPFPSGGSTDAVVRAVGERLAQKWSQPVLVDNKPGAGGNLGAAVVARADGNGYTLLAAPPGPLAINQSLYKGLSYDPRQFVPVTMIANMPSVLVVGPSVKSRQLREFIAEAKARPGKFSFASQGNGSTSHLTGVLFQNLTATEMVHVPYRGSGPALTDMAGGSVDLMFDNLTTSLPMHVAKRVTIIAVATVKRLPTLPDVPTMGEAGLADFVTGTWVGLVAAPGTPDAVASRIAKDVDEVLRQPEIVKLFAQLGAEPVGGTPAATGAFLKAEAERWKRVVDTARVTID